MSTNEGGMEGLDTVTVESREEREESIDFRAAGDGCRTIRLRRIQAATNI